MRGIKSVNIAVLITFAILVQPMASNAEPRAHYLANSGVLVTNGDVKVLFDPLFDNSYGQYQLLPAKMEQDLFAGAPPFDGIDAIFVSHHHGDHFAPASMLSFLKARQDVRLFAPAQAVLALRAAADEDDESVFDRVIGLTLNNADVVSVEKIHALASVAVIIIRGQAVALACFPAKAKHVFKLGEFLQGP